MLGAAFVLIFAAILIGVLAATGVLRGRSNFALLLVFGFALRIVLQLFLRNVPLFSHGGNAGDWSGYEIEARTIAEIWHRFGFHYVTEREIPELAATSLPQNLWAIVFFVSDGAGAVSGCTAMVALAAALTALNVYLLAVEFGAAQRSAMLFATLFFFQPSFLYYTCDMYKDGIVLCLTIGAFGSALRLGFRFSLTNAIVGSVCLFGLWFVRFYLVFVAVLPLLVGLVGVRAGKNSARTFAAGLVLGAAMLVVAATTNLLDLATSRATETFEHGTAEDVLADNSSQGSGVTFDDGGVPYRALVPKVLYTLFSPFPWASGSFGFQLGKIDALIWYFVVYRAVRGARQADRAFITMISTFVIPSTVMYAMSMANVGLIVRQRLVIVAVVFVVAAIYDPKKNKIAPPKSTSPGVVKGVLRRAV